MTDRSNLDRTAGLSSFLAPIPPFMNAPSPPPADPFSATVNGVESQGAIGKFAALNMEAQQPGSFVQRQQAMPQQSAIQQAAQLMPGPVYPSIQAAQNAPFTPEELAADPSLAGQPVNRNAPAAPMSMIQQAAQGALRAPQPGPVQQTAQRYNPEREQPQTSEIQKAAQAGPTPFRDTGLGSALATFIPGFDQAFQAQRKGAIADYVAAHAGDDPLSLVKGLIKLNPANADSYIQQLLQLSEKNHDPLRAQQIEAGQLGIDTAKESRDRQAKRMALRSQELNEQNAAGNYDAALQGIEGTGQNPKSSASGKYQFLDGTWLDTVRKNAPQMAGYSDADILALKKDDGPFKDQMYQAFTKGNLQQLSNDLGREPTQGELYLAHQQGASGAIKLLTNPEKRAVDVVGRDAVINNGGNENMTAAQFTDQWMKRFQEPSQPTANVVQGKETDIQRYRRMALEEAALNPDFNPVPSFAPTKADESTPYTAQGKAASDLKNGLITPEQYKTIAASGVADDSQLSGQPLLDTLHQTDPKTASLVDMALRGDLPISSRGSAKFNDILSMANRVDPTFTPITFQQRQATALEFSPSKPTGKSLISANTLIKHLGEAVDSHDELNNGGVKGWNALVNTGAEHFNSNGDTAKAVTKFKGDVDALAPEMTKFYSGAGQLSEGEIKERRAFLDRDVGTENFRTGAQEAAKLVRDGIQSRLAAYQQVMGPGKRPTSIQPFDDTAVKNFKRFGIDIDDLQQNLISSEEVGGKNAAADEAPPVGALPAGKTFTTPSGITVKVLQ